MRRFGLYGNYSRDFLTYGGRILMHTDQAELEFLTSGSVVVRELPRTIPPEQMMHISQHPQMESVSWPLQRKDFRRG